MKNNITELVFILDRSGSMAGLESDTIGGFNSLIDKQKKQEGECLVTTVLFDSTPETIHDRLDLREIGKMTENEYQVGGCTALIDAIGGTIEHIDTIRKYIRKDDVPEHTMFVIITDGLENASRRFSSAKVKKEIEAHKEAGWEFLFMGANIDAVETAGNLGISGDRSVDYRPDKKGTNVVFETVCGAICEMRNHRPLKASWKKAISEDYESRK